MCRVRGDGREGEWQPQTLLGKCGSKGKGRGKVTYQEFLLFLATFLLCLTGRRLACGAAVNCGAW